MIRFEAGMTDKIVPFGEVVDRNFKKWSFRSNNTDVKFTDTQ